MEAQTSGTETQYDLKERKKGNGTTVINQTAARLAFHVDSSVGFK